METIIASNDKIMKFVANKCEKRAIGEGKGNMLTSANPFTQRRQGRGKGGYAHKRYNIFIPIVNLGIKECRSGLGRRRSSFESSEEILSLKKEGREHGAENYEACRSKGLI